MSTIAQHNIKPIRKGDSFSFPLEFWEDSCQTTGIDVSTYTFKLQAKNDAGVTILTWNNSDFAVVASNKRTVALTPTITNGYTVGQYKYDLQVTTNDGTYTWMVGFLTIEDQITS